MIKLRIKFLFNGKEEVRTAVMTDDLEHPIPHEDNQACGVVDGVADELGIWSIYFDNDLTEADFICDMDDDGNEVKRLIPYEMWVYDENGKVLNDNTPFTVEVL